MSTIGAPSTFKQPSRKGKRAWRKNVDVTEIQSGLEELREEIIQGGVVAEKQDEELFAVDTTGSKEIARKHFKAFKPLKTDEILAARSTVAALGTRKRPNPAVTDGVVEAKRKRKDGIAFKELERLKKIAFGLEAAPAKKVSEKQGEIYDVWEEWEVKDIVEVGNVELSFLEKEKPIKEPVTLKHAPVSLAAVAKKVPAVRLPVAGISYNPEFAKWDELLREEGEKEVELEKLRIAEAAEEKRIKALGATVEEEMIEDNEEEEDEEEDEKKDDVAKKLPERKTQAQRNKIKRRKELEHMQAQQNRLKQQAKELHLIKKYTTDIEAKEKLRLAKLAAAQALEDDEKNPQIMRKKKFGKSALPRAPLELQLPDELSESLRTLKPEGSLLKDRMRSLRERGLLETRLPIVNRQKFKRSETEKWSYKNFK
ncbi:hypothetical protein RUND412_001307 [Rhizina undulata]